MATPQSLFVPVDLQAFCVGIYDVNGKDGSGYGTVNFADVAADFSNLPQSGSDDDIPFLGSETLPALFQTGNSGELKTGIHLHWALPDAIAHGEPDDKGIVEFREAPNRWLVVRMLNDDSNPELKAWVVNSDVLWEGDDDSDGEISSINKKSRAVPVQPVREMGQDAKSFATMGKVSTFEDWSEPGNNNSISKHTAVGYGETTYAAAYAHCQNVFSFYDPMQDYPFDSNNETAHHNFSYLLIGWYSDSEKDPLSKLEEKLKLKYPDTPPTYDQKLTFLEETYKWAFQPDTNHDFPTNTLCHGMIYDLWWEPGKVYVTKPEQGDFKVSIGNNTSEALSALLADDMGDPGAEKVLNILQQGLLAELDKAGGAGEADEKLHSAAFARSNAGSIWLVKRKDADAAQRSQKPSEQDIANNLINSANNLEKELPVEIAHMLDELNVQQMGLDRLYQEIESFQGQLFVDWYKYMVLKYPNNNFKHPSDGDLDQNSSYDFLTEETGLVSGDSYDGTGGKLLDFAHLTQTISTLKQELQSSLKEVDDKLELVEVNAPRYWQATDPVILIAGSEIEASQRHGGDGRFDKDGRLICRISSQLVTQMEAGSVNIGTSSLPALTLSSSPPPFVTEIETLLTEHLLLNPPLSTYLAGKAGNAALAASIKQAQENFLAHESVSGINFSGLNPSPVAYNNWGGQHGQNPWVPLLMQWEVEFNPYLPIKYSNQGSEQTYPEDFITANFDPDDDKMPVELHRKDSPDWNIPQTYNGSILLTSNVEARLKHQIELFVENYPEDANIEELQKILDFMSRNKLPRQSQALSGFNDALLMRELVMQMPVYDPLETSFLRWRFVNGTEDSESGAIVSGLPFSVGTQNIHAPLPLNYYNPLRAGYLKITKLRIIDAYGQIQEIEKPQTVIAESMSGAPIPNVATLPPRITQGSRLLFRWLAASDNNVESNSHPVTTPIFGWILFNHLDESLVVYDGDGMALGSFNLRGNLWQGAAGDQGTFGETDPSKALAQLADTPANQHLKNFVNGLYQHAGDGNISYLKAMLAAIDRSVTTIDPGSHKQHAALSVLMGRPLALTRASVKLELQGLPALDQSWLAFEDAVNGDKAIPSDRDHAKFDGVKFPVQIGDLGKLDDGLIGYFLTDKKDSDLNAYGQFHAHASDGTDQRVSAPTFNDLQLKPSYGVELSQSQDSGKPASVKGMSQEDEIYFTMIVDPRASIHATTGILPVRKIDIPPTFYAKALENMAVTFLTTPVLSSSHKLSIPLPKEKGYKWSWVENNKTGWDSTTDISKVNPRAAFSYPPQRIQEGWLKLSHDEKEADEGGQ